MSIDYRFLFIKFYNLTKELTEIDAEALIFYQLRRIEYQKSLRYLCQ